MPKNWKLKPEIPEDIAQKLSEYPKLVRQMLYSQGLWDVDKIQEFLEPKYENLHSPFLFSDMQKAVERIWEAIDQHQPICIYGDYDADAVTANAVLLQTFKFLGVEATSYIPDRFTEGYGVNLDALSKIKDKGSRIIITVDCGTNSTDAAEYCKQNNIDLIITDHHEIIGETPKVYALINPKNPADSYPCPDITGVGVAFKLACGILSAHEKVIAQRNEPLPASPLEKGRSTAVTPSFQKRGQGELYVKGWEKWLLDLVAIGTVADCHSLLGENRILVKYGLKVLQKTRWVGLRALIESAKLDFNQKPPDAYTLGFIIAPRLNAAGRLEHANIALHLLMETDPVSAQQKAIALEEINRRRQDLTGRVLSEAREQALKYGDRKVLVLLGQDWPKGVVGLVAGRISEEFHKPAIVMSMEETESTGSARTVGEFSILEAIKFASAHLIRFGGHKQAAGLTLKTAEYEQFYGKILEYAETNLTESDLERHLWLEAELGSEDFQLSTFNLITQLEPFGVGNPKPKFLIKNLKISSVRLVGATKQHLQMQLTFNSDSVAKSQAILSPLSHPDRPNASEGVEGSLGSDALARDGAENKQIAAPGLRSHSLATDEILSANGLSSADVNSNDHYGGVGSPSQSPGLLAMTEKRDQVIPAIMFNALDFAKTLKVGDTIDAAAELIEDGWNGRKEVKLRIIDIKKSNDASKTDN